MDEYRRKLTHMSHVIHETNVRRGTTKKTTLFFRDKMTMLNFVRLQPKTL